MSINFKSSFSAAKRITEIQQRNKQRLGSAITDAKAKLLQDIGAGKGVEAPLKEYSPAYKKFKQKAGRSGTVDLRFKGNMLKAMQVTVEEFGDKLRGRIYFLAQEVDKARWNQKLRYFFGLSSEQIKNLKRKLNVK